MSTVMIIARKEYGDRLRNRWILSATLLLAALSLGLSLLGSAPVGSVGVGSLEITVVSLASLSIFLLPLIALMLAYDGIVGEAETGQLTLLLTYPVERWEILAGKFLGHAMVITTATAIGYGVALLVPLFGTDGLEQEGLIAFARLLSTSILMALAFTAMAMLFSVASRERGVAAAWAVAVWLLFVLLFDAALLGVLVAAPDWIPPEVFPYLLMLNPADAFRIFNLGGLDNIRQFSGMLAGMEALPGWLPITAMMVWIAAPLGVAGLLFQRREI
ncbi:ABC transporter permease subunit [Magnetococcus sp. PR-3]|uniref:ABC transporter permease subunit n=1 Tax=Magnetococcus sp. PR-3 TaxID=3120355 RepID=UPI002FCE2A34